MTSEKIYDRLNAWKRVYADFFSIHEWRDEQSLIWLIGALLLTFYATFSSWSLRPSITIEAVQGAAGICWPFFQSCTDWYVLHTLPIGYSQTTVYMLLFGIMAAVVYALYKKEYAGAHLGLTILFLWKVFVILLSLPISGPYDYYDTILLAVVLFLPYKLFFARFTFVFFYFICATIKFHAGWIVATYFTALNTGLPWIPDMLVPVAANIVIAEQVVGAWFLLSKNKLSQRITFIFYIFFHIYSGVFVVYRYPTSALPILLILFGSFYAPKEVPLDRRSIAGWTFIAILLFFQMIGYMIPGDQKLTLEGNAYGMYMFEANHQCISTKTPGNGKSEKTYSNSAWRRCDPYRTFFLLKKECARDPKTPIAWTFDHSINGDPFLRIVDVPNVCDLEYEPFSHNSWIRTEKDNPAQVGIPVRNIYAY